MNIVLRGLVWLVAALALCYIIGAAALYVTSDKPAERVSFGFPVPSVVSVPAWERKRSLEGQSLKVGLITDTHLDSKRVVPKGDPLVVKIPDRYQSHLDAFVESMKEFQPKFIVHLGDVIEGTKVDREVGVIEIGLVREAIERAGIQTYWAVGNHDLRSVTRRNFQEITGQDSVNKVIDEGSYRFILLDPNYRPDGTPGNPLSGDFVSGFVPKETIAWLEKVLDTDQRVYIFAHHSFVPESMTLKRPIANHEEVRALFARYNVEAVFDGHIEKRFFAEIDGVGYYMFPGTKKQPLFPGAYYAMTLNEGVPEIRIYYQDSETDSLEYIEEDFADVPFDADEMFRQIVK